MTPEAILLVDDDTFLLESAKDILEDAGFRVLTATQGDQALKTFQQEPVRVVISDLNLPDMKGVDLAPKLQMIRADVKVILMTGMEGHASTTAGPFIATLLKPVDPAQLIQLIRTALID